MFGYLAKKIGHCAVSVAKGGGAAASGFSNTLSVVFNRASTEFARKTSPSAAIGSGITSALTVSMWIKTTESTGAVIYPFSSHYNATTSQSKWWFGMQGNGLSTGRLRFVTSNNGTSASIHDQGSGATVNDGNWHHVCVSYNGSGNIVMYIDGTAIYTGAAVHSSLFNSSAPFDIAHVTGGSSTEYYWSGNADEVGLFNTPLNATEVSEIYNSGSPANLSSHSKSANLVGYWRMGDGDTHPTLQDQINSNDLTMTNMVAGDIVSDVP